MRKLKYRLKFLLASCAVWQPWPYIAFSMKDGENLSWWFEKKVFPNIPDSCLYQKNKLGLWWAMLFWKLSSLISLG